MNLDNLPILGEELRMFLRSEGATTDRINVAKAKLFLRELDEIPRRLQAADLAGRQVVQDELTAYLNQVRSFLASVNRNH